MELGRNVKKILRNYKDFLLDYVYISLYNQSVLTDVVHLIQTGGKNMKKSTIIIALGIFIVVTAFLGMSNEKMYQKQKHFETTSEIVDQLKNNPIKAIDEKGNFSETDQFKECLSERIRLTDSQFNYTKIETEKVEELSEKQKQSVLEKYEALRNKFSKRRVIKKEEVLRLDVNAYRLYGNQANASERKSDKLKLDLVLVDEGEGLVIDYIVERHDQKLDEEGNEDA